MDEEHVEYNILSAKQHRTFDDFYCKIIVFDFFFCLNFVVT